MRPILLSVQDYFDHFQLYKHGTGGGIGIDSMSNEQLFWVQAFVPKEFFGLDDHRRVVADSALALVINEMPDSVHVRLELIGIGCVDDMEAYIFKIWALNVEHPMVFSVLECFPLFVPGILFFNLIEQLKFSRRINPIDFGCVRVLNKLPSNTFQRYGLDRSNISKVMYSKNLVISRLYDISKSEITEFYTENWRTITSDLEHVYFRPILNTWFRITEREISDKQGDGNQSLEKRTVGFLRLYNNNSSFTGGTSLEYIIGKEYRRKGYATEALSILKDYLPTSSHFLSIGAEVEDDNEVSKKILRRLGFSECQPDPFNRHNYKMSLHGNLKALEERYKRGDFTGVDVYEDFADDYERYFFDK